MVVRLGRFSWRRAAAPIFLAAVGVALVTAGFLRPVPSYLVAATDLVPGVLVSESDLIATELDLGELGPSYLTELSPGSAVTDFVGRGELLPKRLIADFRSDNQTQLRIIPAADPAGSIVHGSTVAVWQVVEIEDQVIPEQVVAAALVVAITDSEGLFASDVAQYELLLSQNQATTLIAAMASELPLYLVPAL